VYQFAQTGDRGYEKVLFISLSLHAGSNRTHLLKKMRSPMSIAKIIELSPESPKNFEEVIQNGITRASKTIHGIKSAWVKEQHVVIDNGKVTLYRVDLKVTFVLD
jgi:flavin-binding protein dodecin